jgi:hypothetical protein
LVLAPPDAAEPTPVPPPPLDAAELTIPVDAPPRHRPRPDARVAAVPPIDAAPPEAGVGRITIPIKNGLFYNLLIDGVSVVSPHINKPISAGTHTVVFLDPKTGQVLRQTTIQVHDGDKITVQPP